MPKKGKGLDGGGGEKPTNVITFPGPRLPQPPAEVEPLPAAELSKLEQKARTTAETLRHNRRFPGRSMLDKWRTNLGPDFAQMTPAHFAEWINRPPRTQRAQPGLYFLVAEAYLKTRNIVLQYTDAPEIPDPTRDKASEVIEQFGPYKDDPRYPLYSEDALDRIKASLARLELQGNEPVTGMLGNILKNANKFTKESDNPFLLAVAELYFDELSREDTEDLDM